MRKTILVAWREFTSTVLTKGFIFGVLLTPMLGLVAVGGVLLLRNIQPPRVAGVLAVIDRSGLAAEAVAARFTEAGARAEEDDRSERAGAAIDNGARGFGIADKHKDVAKGMIRAQVHRSIASLAGIRTEILPADADAEHERAILAAADARSADSPDQRIALAVIPAESVLAQDSDPFAGFQLFLAPRLDFEVQQLMTMRIAEGVVDARVANHPSLIASGIDAAAVRRILQPPRAAARAVTLQGEKATMGVAAMLIPAAFMILLMISVMAAGQYLLTTTIEEKSSRVIEVLLSAVSPMELMVGKVLGQMGVGLLILGVYSGVGIASLLFFSAQHLVDPWNLVYLVVFFIIAFFLVASTMAAIGSAVSELREAQTLQTPVMLALVIPWLLWMPIQRSPNSTFATVMSFIPGLNPFVMVIRVAGSEPIPQWQIPASIIVGFLSVVFMAWAAAKVFRIGVLMYGKPPNFATLIRWVRMA